MASVWVQLHDGKVTIVHPGGYLAFTPEEWQDLKEAGDMALHDEEPPPRKRKVIPGAPARSDGMIAGLSVACSAKDAATGRIEHGKCVVGCGCTCHAREYQVVVPASMQPNFEQWLRTCGWYLFPIPPTPGADDLPTFGIAPKG